MEFLNQFDPNRLRVSVGMSPSLPPIAEAAPVRTHRGGRRQEYMPQVDWGWFTQMTTLPGKAGWIGLTIYRLTILRKKRTVTINRQQLADELGINRKAVYNGLAVLERERVLRIITGGRGSFATVELLIEP